MFCFLSINDRFTYAYNIYKTTSVRTVKCRFYFGEIFNIKNENVYIKTLYYKKNCFKNITNLLYVSI